uniref:DUF4283 domain-containing protein n=1 Tax=Tanacetum cinerariifolium TaxID=118510 RepID=A0A6L2J7T3_TANCI|nr:hypothetical protein [Tanacetum cinerariifolium]
MKGISALASSLGKPSIMDDMTARMCAKREGRLNFARVLIEIEVGKDLKKAIEVVYKGNIHHDKFTKKILVEYAWKPPCCDKCQVFRHDNKSCMFKEKEVQGKVNENIRSNRENNTDRHFTVVQNRKMNYSIMIGEIMVGGIIGRNRTMQWELLMELMIEEATIGEGIMRFMKEIWTKLKEKENEVCDIDSLGWNKEMKNYYKDRKDIFDAAKEMELEEDVEDETQDEEEFGLGNEASGEDGNILV